ncbi:serine/threonine-protein kinase [Vitiosangium sp. GDMCC 1.1324]|uniref:serine/threonine-protein kinase n=1 Tax=Vitiosangium sp. (strain GDMCC 1.1324) TaxID=2138576 RepID=UPI000D384842|nr:serine/threonine-protein kinase [Vitiosangium sp. GDMCC 1.1324]PTL79961.1 serine/threonine protein kinase [Vitiosangium sp. GDMCC 1.1324]
MFDAYDSELRMAVAKGLLSRDEAEALHVEALRLGRASLELLVERGLLSADSLASLRGEAAPGPVPPSTLTPHSTLTLDSATRNQRALRVPPFEETPDFPVSGWERYRYVRLLGQGGMGRVYLAHDMKLRRDVALKFVRDDDPDTASRFVFEARAQARVVHERVCQVYEVGEFQGRTYIAMQYIDGQTLNQMAKHLTVEQKAMVLRDAAEGVHAAHRAGLIHRDLKPSNILVARTEDGKLEPYVMDFGLARDWKEGTTATGSVLGTPHYMAPEQARGEVARLDRRADVYSLGATLYHLLTGTFPIPGKNHLEVLSNIPLVEPRPPRSLDVDIPVDLEAIVLKCLEKDRSARYDSARALAEDLDRFLNGEPVRARPIGPWSRLRKKARQHRALVITGSVALIVVALAVGQAVLASREASQRELLASRFTAKAKDIEGHALHSHLSPPHDTRADRETIQAWMRELEAEMREAGDLGQGPGHYALGQGFLALGDQTKAREHLEAAWKRGFREPQVAYTLALVMGHLYQERLLEVERDYQQQRGKADPSDTSPQRRREARKQELERSLRDPALAYLRRSAGAPVPPDYVAALLAFFEGRLDDALARLDALGDSSPGFYEAPRLRGDIFLASATAHWNQGGYEQARAAFAASRRAYERAVDIGRSNPALHHALARLELAVMEMELYGHGDIEPPFQRGLQAVSRALAVAPDHYESRVLEARFHRRLAEDRITRGGDVQEPLQHALEAARAARELAPERPEARKELGWLFLQWGRTRQLRNQDPREQLRQAVDVIEGLALEDRDAQSHRLLGLIYGTWAEYDHQTGQDSLPRLGKAIESYRTAVKMDGTQLIAWTDLVNAYLLRVSRPRAPDPDGDLERARQALGEARALNPRSVLLYYYEGQVHERKANRSGAHPAEARAELEKALERYRQGLAIDGRLPYLLNGEGLVLTRLAGEAWDHGEEPFPLLAQAQHAFEQAIQVAPRKFSAYNNLGWMQTRRATWLRAQGEEPGPSVRAAQEAYQKALQLAPEHPLPWANLSQLYYTQAAFELDQGRDPSRSLSRASEALREALARNPNDSDNELNLGRVRELQARWKARQGQAHATDFKEAEQAFRRALELDPTQVDSRLTLGHFYREWAAWTAKRGENPHPLLEQGLALARALLEERPHWPEARVLRASLVLARAEGSAQPEQQMQWNQAQEDFTQALADNRNLEHTWAHQLQRVQRLIGSARPPGAQGN